MRDLDDVERENELQRLRMRRDSNPRGPKSPTGLAGQRLNPLGHASTDKCTERTRNMSEQYKDELQPFMDEALKNPAIRAAYERASAPPTRPLRKWLPYAMVALVLLAVVTLLIT